MPERKTPPVNHEPFINSRLDKVGPPRLEDYEDKSKFRDALILFKETQHES